MRKWRWFNGHPKPFVYGHAATRAGLKILGQTHSHWKGGRTTINGYVALYLPDHHLAGKTGYVLEHRKVWEDANGRQLKTGEVVHHRNGNRLDNRPENLEVLSRHAHSQLHRPVDLRWVKHHNHLVPGEAHSECN